MATMMMDEVFGNSSNETVVSVDDESKEDFSKNQSLSEDDSECSDVFYANKDLSGCSSHNSSYQRLSVIKRVVTIKTKLQKEEAFDDNFKVPLPPSSTSHPLRHTQSAVVSGASVIMSRPRAHSTTATSEIPVANTHAYQNIPINSFKHPSYVNLPQKKRTVSSFKKDVIPKDVICESTNTPEKTLNPQIKGSYIQLWTGARQKRNLSESDSDENDGDSMSCKPSQAGYVKMSSPYVRSPNSSMLSGIASKIASFSGISARDFFCPFCPRPFTSEMTLSLHMQAIHRHEVTNVVCRKDLVPVQYCPLCQGLFFNLDILPSHLLEFHRGSIVSLLDKHQCLEIVDDNSVKCPFCPKKVPLTNLGEDVLLFHLLQFHNTEYEYVINSLFQPEMSNFREDFNLSSEDLTKLLSCKSDAIATPGLSIKFKSLSCHLDSESKQCCPFSKAWSSRSTKSNEENRPSFPKGKGILRSAPFLPGKKPTVKRELRFTVPPVTSEQVFVPDSPENPSDLKDDDDDEESNADSIDLFHRRSDKIPVRIDSLSSADFIDMNPRQPCRKKRRMALCMKSKRKKKENLQTFDEVFSGNKTSNRKIVPKTSIRSFRKPIPVEPPRVPTLPLSSSNSDIKTVAKTFVKTRSSVSTKLDESTYPDEGDDHSAFSNMKLYAPLRMFRCNGCRLKFLDNESLSSHIKCKHKGFLGYVIPHFGCGICSAKFYENKYLVKHCLQHHTSLLEIRSPKKNKITIYRFSHD